MIPYNIDTYYKDIKDIAMRIQIYEDEVSSEHMKWSPSLIVGIARGGLVPSVYLSHLLSRPMKSITWQLRDGAIKESLYLSRDQQVLLVDDINDSGETFSQILEDIADANVLGPRRVKQNIKTAALWERTSSIFNVDFKAKSIDTKDWIIFPWELPPEKEKR